MKKKSFIALMVTAIILSSCKVKIPTNEKECLVDSKTIINHIKHSQYDKLVNYINRYKEYQNYTSEDFKKMFTPLEKALVNIDVNSLKSIVRKDSILIDYGTSKDYIVNIVIEYFIAETNKVDIPACDFRYSQEHNDPNYYLTYFDHSFRVKLKPELPF
jgi:hypothetical protein